MEKLFLVQLKNRYQALVEQEDHTNNNVDEINSLWNTVEKSYQETSKEIMGHREKRHQEWISQAEDRRKKKLQAKTTRNKIRATQGRAETSI